MILKRMAGHFFWAARYLERAEWRARLLDVHYKLLVESSAPPGGEEWGSPLAITGDREDFSERYAVADERSVLEFFIMDPANPSSIRSCIASARENCRAARNRMSTELWLEVNELHLDSQRWTSAGLREQRVESFFSDLRERFYQISGIVQNTLTRDLSFDFYSVGRWLEAAENVTRLLDVKYHFLLPNAAQVGSSLDLAQWAALLRSASALEAYRNTYGNMIRIDRVVEFLLFDSSFTRAAHFCIERLDAALKRIGSAGPDGSGEVVPSSGLLACRLRKGSAAAVIASGLHEYLMTIQDDCARIGDEIFGQYLELE